MKYAYYPGCAAHSTARDMHESSVAVARVLGLELEEIQNWTCCGATAAHQTDRLLAASLPAANLARARDSGMDMLVNCAACYNRSKNSNYEIQSSPAVRQAVAAALGRDYDGSTAVRHFVEVLLEDVGLVKLKKSLKRSFNGLKVAAYYGCFLVRPPEVTRFDDPENHVFLDHLINALGGQSVEWPGKVECCGGSLSLTRTDVVVKLSGTILDMAQAAGAQCLAVACPMCQSSLDLRQKDIEKATGQRYNLPVLYITQLIGLGLGISPRELGLNRLMVPPAAVLTAVGASI
jgi:heterodisulfide reductase subunit B